MTAMEVQVQTWLHGALPKKLADCPLPYRSHPQPATRYNWGSKAKWFLPNMGSSSENLYFGGWHWPNPDFLRAVQWPETLPINPPFFLLFFTSYQTSIMVQGSLCLCPSALSFTGFCSHKSLFCLILSWPPLLEGLLENTLASMWNQATLPYFLPGQVWCYQRRRFRTAQEKPQPHGSFIPVPTFGINCASEAGYEAEEIDHPLQDTWGASLVTQVTSDCIQHLKPEKNKKQFHPARLIPLTGT